MRHRTMRRVAALVAVAAGMGMCACFARAAAVAVTVEGLSASTSQNWVTNGLATLDGTTSGLNWLVSAQQENSDWTRLDGANQGAIGGATVEWPTAGQFAQLTYSGSPGVLGIGPEMPADLAGTAGLRIAEVTPTTGTYTLNGVSQTATAVGQVLVWRASSSVTPGDTLTFTHDANISAGPIGFSAVVPEPSTALLLVGTLIPLGQRRRRGA